MSEFAFTFSATDTQLRNFYEQRKSVVWDVIVECEKENTSEGGTAFALDAKGLLMTCAHMFPSDYPNPEKPCTVHVLGLGEPNHHTAEVVKINREWDMVLLQVKVVNNNYDYATLSDNGNLSVDQMLVHIGHPRSLYYSYLVGKVAYKCIDTPTIPTGITISCDQYKVTVTAPATQRGYRILGDKYPISDEEDEEDYPLPPDEESDEEDEEDEEDYPLPYEEDYRLPIVQMYTLGVKNGSSGGPIFDGRGDVVGMLISSYGCYCIATHVSVLRVFLDEWKRKVATEKKKKKERRKVAHQVGGSRRPKRKSRKISSAAGLEAQQHNRSF